MKKFGRKKSLEEKNTPPAKASESEESFYAQPLGEAPLNEFTDEHGRQTRMTSRHSPARRRENNNRAGDKEILFLLLRAGLIVFLLAGGFFALKIILGKLQEKPSEKAVAKWAKNAELMEGGESPLLLTEDKGSAETQAVSAELVGQRLRSWREAERHFRAAEMRERDGLGEAAAVRLIQALRFAPDHQSAQKLLMEIYIRSEKYAEAIPLCVRLLDQDSRQWGIRATLLNALQKVGQTEACLVLAKQMLEQQPNNLELLEVAAFAQRAAGEDEEALALFDRILNNNGRHAVALSGSGAICQGRGDWEKATTYYLELVREHPALENYHQLVRCYAQMEEAGKAIIFMGQAASLYGQPEISGWLRYDLEAFDLIRETVAYRSFADRLVGEETRRAIEDIRRREIEKKSPDIPGGLDLPAQPELKISR